MRKSLLAAPLAALLVALAGCDGAAPEAPDATALPAEAGFLVETVDARTGAVTTSRQEKLAVCHYDADTGAYERISVGAPALPAHLRHGDGVPGGEVFGAEVPSKFGDNCEVIPVGLPVGCTAERVVNGDGTWTVSITGVLLEEERPVSSVAAFSTAASNGIDERVGPYALTPIYEGGVTAGFTMTQFFLEGADDTVLFRLTDFDGGFATLVCGPYVVSEIPLAGSEA